MSDHRPRAFALMYHDVVARESWDSSGFPGPGASRYKLGAEQFEAHLSAISRVRPGRPATVLDLLAGGGAGPPPTLLTFDDGGIAAAVEIAPRLERVGWRGHFFVPTNFLGSPTFLDRTSVRELHRRGHVIGSHSASHPPRISACSRAEMLAEWRTSVEILSEIVGERVRTASVPEGYYSEEVAATAGEAGIEALFTSEPTFRASHVGRCLVLGRYMIQRSTPASIAAGLAAGALLPTRRQSIAWAAKELPKRLLGERYLSIRALLLGINANHGAAGARLSASRERRE